MNLALASTTVGRERQIEALERFLAGAGQSLRRLLVEGEAGPGTTAVSPLNRSAGRGEPRRTLVINRWSHPLIANPKGGKMKRSILSSVAAARLIATLTGTLVLGLSNASLAVPITVPTGLDPGDQYRLAFVAGGTNDTPARDATSTDIADYDAFVQAVASTQPALAGISWQVIGSTATVSAVDHTGTNPTDPGVPIYLLNDTLLANDYADLWDGTIVNALRIFEDGLPFSCPGPGPCIASPSVFTGTNADGTVFSGSPLGGSTTVRGGIWTITDSNWTSQGNYLPSQTLPFYAISEVLTVSVPEPGIGLLLATGLLGLVTLRRA